MYAAFDHHLYFQHLSTIKANLLFEMRSSFHQKPDFIRFQISTLGIPRGTPLLPLSSPFMGSYGPPNVGPGLLIPTRADSSPCPKAAASPLELRGPCRGRRGRSHWASVVAGSPKTPHGKITIFNGKIHYKWLFSIAMMGLSENSVPLNPMVLLIIIPMTNGYFIGNIPYFQTNPDHSVDTVGENWLIRLQNWRFQEAKTWCFPI